MSFEKEREKVEKKFGKSIEEIREYYLELPEQEKADLLYQNNIPGHLIGLSPSEYPKVAATHKPCKFCGGKGIMQSEYTGSNGEFKRAIKCEKCGRKTATMIYPTWSAWRIWDAGDYGEEETQISLFDYMADNL